MPSRPVAQKVWDGSTSTGTGAVAHFGEGCSRGTATILVTNASTKGVAGNLQMSMGGSTGWINVVALTTSNSTGTVMDGPSTGGLGASSTSISFDKLRVNLSTNNTTGTLDIWAGCA